MPGVLYHIQCPEGCLYCPHAALWRLWGRCPGSLACCNCNCPFPRVPPPAPAQITMDASCSVLDLKYRVYDLSAVAPERQKLLGLPKTLTDDSLLSAVPPKAGACSRGE